MKHYVICENKCMTESYTKNELDTKFDEVDTRVDEVDTRVDEVNGRVDDITPNSYIDGMFNLLSDSVETITLSGSTTHTFDKNGFVVLHDNSSSNFVLNGNTILTVKTTTSVAVCVPMIVKKGDFIRNPNTWKLNFIFRPFNN